MSIWTTVLLSSVTAFAMKFSGFLVPERWLGGIRTTRITTLLPVALLAALLATQTFAGRDHGITLDARAAAVACAVVLLVARVNFLVVVFGAATVAAVLRAAGWG